METIVYYEGSESVKDWVAKLLNKNDCIYRKIPTSNRLTSFSQLPSYIADILYLDKPDIIISGTNDGIHERPIFSIELATCTPQFQHSLQRFSRSLASVSGGCPTVLIMPAKKRANDGGNVYHRSPAVDYGAVRLMDVYRVPALVVDWPETDGLLLFEEDDKLPPLASEGIVELGLYLQQCIEAFKQVDYVGALSRLALTQKLVDQTRTRAYAKGAITPRRPGGGDKGGQVKLEILKTHDLIKRLLDEGRATPTSISQIPDYFNSREESLLFFPTRVAAHSGDPYVGMMTYYDVAFCRTGQTTRDRRYNLVAYAEGVDISETTASLEDFNTKTCLFKVGYKPSNARHYSYYLRDGCRKLKSKPLRIYGELADMVAYTDGILMNP